MTRSSRTALAVGTLFVFTVALLQVGWWIEVFGSPDPLETAWRDWIQFHRTALRMVSDQGGEIYPGTFLPDGRPEFSDGFFFLYPPPVIGIILPLAVLARLTAYMACVVAVAGGTVVATLAVLRGLGVRRTHRWLAVLGTMAAAPWNGAVFLGHLSVLLLFGPALAILAGIGRRPFWAGCAMSILLLKPNLGLPMLVLLVCGQRWKLVGGFLSGGACLILASLPLGPGLWVDWVQTMAEYRGWISDATAPWKQVTLYASLQSLLQRPGSDVLVVAPWMTLSLVGFGWSALAWFRHGLQDENLPRLLGVALLAILVFNPYAYFYDVLLVAPSALVLWTQPGSYRSSGFRRGAQMASLVTYLWMYVQYFLLMDGGPSLAGIGLATWLFFELADLRST